MKLKRCRDYHTRLYDAESGGWTKITAGSWQSVDEGWRFYRREGRWYIHTPGAPGFAPDSPERLLSDLRRDQLFLSGLFETTFKTRREAVQAVELLIAGMPELAGEST